MKFVPMIDLLNDALERGYAVPSFCVWNADVVQAVLNVAQRLNAPVILMNGPAEHSLFRPSVMGPMIRAVASGYEMITALLLDHGDSLECVTQCIEAGYTSVMLDFSARSFEDNAGALKDVVAMAHPKGITVEGEIGAVGRVDDSTAEGNHKHSFTDPDEAARYVAETGVDALAISIGNAHGNYATLPQLDFERLAAIHERVGVPLVLHGGSGTPDEDIHRAISLGIAKVNVASALVSGKRESLIAQWTAGENPWIAEALAVAGKEVEKAVEEWIIRVKADGKA